MTAGWVLLHRKLWKNKVLKDEKFTEREAWIWLFAHASHKDRTISIGNEVVPIARGEHITSFRKLAATFKWGTRKCRLFLRKLEKTTQLRLQTRPHQWTQISICNYEEYQKMGHSQGHTDGHTDDSTYDHTYDHTDDPHTTNYNITNGNNEEVVLPGFKFLRIPQDFYSRLKEAYPTLDHDQELKRADLWFEANPKRRKKNHQRFIQNWFKEAGNGKESQGEGDIAEYAGL